jgi:hypothetical protein
LKLYLSGWVGGWVAGWLGGGWVAGWLGGWSYNDYKAKLSSIAIAIASWN